MLDPLNEEPYFVLNDVLQALTGKSYTGDYVKKFRKSHPLIASLWKSMVVPIQVRTGRGIQTMNGINALNVLTVIQFIPAVELIPFRAWMAELALNELKSTDGFRQISQRIRELTTANLRTKFTEQELNKSQDNFIFQFMQIIHNKRTEAHGRTIL